MKTQSIDLTPLPDLQSGLHLLAELPLASPFEAQEGLDIFLNRLLQTAFPLEDQLELLEQARLSLCFVAEELSRCYTGKSLPLDEESSRLFHRTTALWEKVLLAYSRCVRSELSQPDGIVSDRLALILHRCITYAGVLMTEHYRVRCEPEPGLWKAVHSYYECAENNGVAELPVEDNLTTREGEVHCLAAYVTLLLFELASPHARSISDQKLIYRWAEAWAGFVTLQPFPEDEAISGGFIDLHQDMAVSTGHRVKWHPWLRRLDSKALGKHLKTIVEQLQQKRPPSEIGLGPDCTLERCRRLISKIASPWLQIIAPRKYPRRSSSGGASVCTSFDAIHYLLADEESTLKPVPGKGKLVHFCWGKPEFTLEYWDIVNQSATGFRLVRQLAGKPVVHGQLLAARPNEGGIFMLGCVNWIMQEGNDRLIVGVEIFPGQAQSVDTRPADTASALFYKAILLPAIPTIGSKDTLILSRDFYSRSRSLEIRTMDKSKTKTIELGRLLNEGEDFVRCRFKEI